MGTCGGGPKLCRLLLFPCHNRVTLGRRRARGRRQVLLGQPGRGPTGGSRERRRGADGRSDEVARAIAPKAIARQAPQGRRVMNRSFDRSTRVRIF